MKTFLAIVLLFALVPTLVFAEAPALLAPQAAAIAQQDLDDRGLQTQVYIADIRYKKGSFGAKEHWEVLWSATFPAKTEGRNEFGLKIFMDGNYSRSVR